jgi:hypothetical protein
MLFASRERSTHRVSAACRPTPCVPWDEAAYCCVPLHLLVSPCYQASQCCNPEHVAHGAWCPCWCVVQEEEARLKPGTLKALAFAVMKQRGVTAPVSADDIVRITTTDGSRIDWPDKSKRHLSQVSLGPERTVTCLLSCVLKHVGAFGRISCHMCYSGVENTACLTRCGGPAASGAAGDEDYIGSSGGCGGGVSVVLLCCRCCRASPRSFVSAKGCTHCAAGPLSCRLSRTRRQQGALVGPRWV